MHECPVDEHAETKQDGVSPLKSGQWQHLEDRASEVDDECLEGTTRDDDNNEQRITRHALKDVELIVELPTDDLVGEGHVYEGIEHEGIVGLLHAGVVSNLSDICIAHALLKSWKTIRINHCLRAYHPDIITSEENSKNH